MNRAERLGFARITWSLVPPTFEFYWPPPGYGYDPVKARQLLAEAGYPHGFDTGDYFCDAALTYMGEPVVNYLNAVGEQATELDVKKREAILHRIQQLIYEKVLVAPIWQNVPLNGIGSRVEEAGIGLVAGYIFSAPYEDVKLKHK